MTEEQIQNIEFVRSFFISQIKKVKLASDKLGEILLPEVRVAVIHLNAFYDYIVDKKFDNIEEWLMFMNNNKTMVDKISYVSNYLSRVLSNNNITE